MTALDKLMQRNQTLVDRHRAAVAAMNRASEELAAAHAALEENEYAIVTIRESGSTPFDAVSDPKRRFIRGEVQGWLQKNPAGGNAADIAAALSCPEKSVVIAAQRLVREHKIVAVDRTVPGAVDPVEHYSLRQSVASNQDVGDKITEALPLAAE